MGAVTHGERPSPRVVQGRIYGTEQAALLVDGTERGDSTVTVRLRRNAAFSPPVELGPDALRALAADLRERLLMLEAFAPEEAR